MKYTIKDFNKAFKTEDDCLEHIFKSRIGENSPCPKCGFRKWYRITGRKVWSCGKCRYQVHPLAGSIFHKSDTPLMSWFFAIYKFANSRNGVAAKELQRDLGVTYKCAWRIGKQVRKLMEMDDYKLGGNVEVDEAEMKVRPKVKGQKTDIVAMVERGGSAKVKAMEYISSSNIIPMIKSEVKQGSNVMTDASRLYSQSKLPNFKHSFVNHSKGEYSLGNVHINTTESLFGQIKRSISGTYHQVSEQHLQSYLDEFAWRFSHGRLGIPLFVLLLNQLCQAQRPAIDKI